MAQQTKHTLKQGSTGKLYVKEYEEKKKSSKRRSPIYIVAGVLFLCIVAVLTLIILYSDVNYKYCLELGDLLPSSSVFSKNGDAEMAYITDMNTIDVSKIGKHWLHVSVDGKDRLVRLVVKDTIAPAAQPVELNIAINEQIAPDQLISDLVDADMVKLNWEQAPPFGTAGDYSVVIEMEDLSGNTASVVSTLHIRAVVDAMTYEAGDKLPTLQEFLANEELDAAFITDLGALPLDTPGEYDVSIEVKGVPYTTRLIVADTIRPEMSVQMVYIRPGESVMPEDFVAAQLDATALSFEFAEAPDCNNIGFQEIGITATDAGGNTVSETAMLLVSDVAPAAVEIRDTPLTVEELVDTAAYGTAALEAVMIPDTLGEYNVAVSIDGQTHPTLVTVVDTTPPIAEAVDVAWYLAHPLSAEYFVENAFDYTDITYTFAEEPDWDMEEQQSVGVVLTDVAGNRSEYTASMTLGHDTEPPSLYGVKDRYCYIGQAVAYFAEVFAEDNCDFEVPIEVDNSKVDMNMAGEYEVVYSAVDSSGNLVEKSCVFTFVEETVTDEELNAAADEVLSEITTDDMSIGQKAYVIFKYVKQHVKYSGSSDKSDWKYEAYRGITSGRGDCFTFYAVAKCLMERIGAQTICVERHGGNRTTHHYWLLVNLGTGWYHVDAINVGPRNYDCFMKTDEELWARGRNFWCFDKSLYPPTPEESYVLE